MAQAKRAVLVVGIGLSSLLLGYLTVRFAAHTFGARSVPCMEIQ